MNTSSRASNISLPNDRGSYWTSIGREHQRFFKASKLRLVQRHLLEFSQIAMANAQGSEAMLNRVMTKDNIGLVAILELIDSDQEEQYNCSLTAECCCFNCNQSDIDNELAERPRKQAHLSASAAAAKCEQTLPIRRQVKEILVCNTHIHWDPECCDVKLIQTIMLMNELECIARHHSLLSFELFTRYGLFI